MPMERWSRRRFFLTSLASSIAAGASKLFGKEVQAGNGTNARAENLASMLPAQGVRPLIISSANGVNALDRGMEILRKGGDTLDAVVAAVMVVEDDPNDTSVGYGGLPNEDGEVELDASVMHGPTRRAGSGASAHGHDPMHGGQRKRRHLRHHHDFGAGVENRRARRRFTHYRRRVLRGQRRRGRGFDG